MCLLTRRRLDGRGRRAVLGGHVSRRARRHARPDDGISQDAPEVPRARGAAHAEHVVKPIGGGQVPKDAPPDATAPGSASAAGPGAPLAKSIRRNVIITSSIT